MKLPPARLAAHSLLAFWLSAGPAVCDSQQPTGVSQAEDPEVAAFVATDTKVRIAKRGDLDDDGSEDVLLVLEKKTPDASASRGLMILRRGVDGRFQKMVDNPHAVLCPSCGGTMGDPLAEVTTYPGGFALTFEGGSRELWSRTYRFGYSKSDHDWYLEHVSIKTMERMDGRQQEHNLTPETADRVSIRDFEASTASQSFDQPANASEE